MSQTFYSIGRGHEHSISYKALKEFESVVNKRLATKSLKVHVALIPVSRDQLIPTWLAGRGDRAVANLTITPGRLESVDFSEPLLTDVSELVVTGPDAPPLASLDDLAGKEVSVRASKATFTPG